MTSVNLATSTSSLGVVILVTVTNGVLRTMIPCVILSPDSVTVRLARVRSAPERVTGALLDTMLMSTILCNAFHATVTRTALLTAGVISTLAPATVGPMSKEINVTSVRRDSMGSILLASVSHASVILKDPVPTSVMPSMGNVSASLAMELLILGPARAVRAACTSKMAFVSLAAVTLRGRTAISVPLTALVSVLIMCCLPLGANVTSVSPTTTLAGQAVNHAGVTVLELLMVAWTVTLIQGNVLAWRSVRCSSWTPDAVSRVVLISGTPMLSAQTADVTRMGPAVYSVISTLGSVRVWRERMVSRVTPAWTGTLIWNRDVCHVTVTKQTLLMETLPVTRLDNVGVRLA